MRAHIALLIVLLALPSTLAIGVSPASAQIDFAPEYSGAFDLLITNTGVEDIGTQVEITGTLAEYFTAEAPEIRARGGAKSEITFALPEDIPPGENIVRIRYLEDYFSEQTGAVAARAAVTAKITVWKPYPGKYAELRVIPTHVPAGQDTQVEIRIASRGEEAITGDLNLRIYDPENTLVDTIRIEDIQIEGDSDYKRFKQIFSSDYQPGKYRVYTTFDYNAGVAESEETLIMGEENIDIISLTPINIYTDKEVTRFDVVVESLWNQPLRVVAANMQLGSSTGATPAITLPAFSQKTLTGYWQTDQDLTVGEKQALVTASFDGGEPVQKFFTVQVYNETPVEEPQEQEPTIVLGLSDILFIILSFVFIGYFIIHIAKRHHEH